MNSLFNFSIRLSCVQYDMPMPLWGRDHSTHCIRGWVGPKSRSRHIEDNYLETTRNQRMIHQSSRLQPCIQPACKCYTAMKINRRILMLVHMYAILRTNLLYFFKHCIHVLHTITTHI